MNQKMLDLFKTYLDELDNSDESNERSENMMIETKRNQKTLNLEVTL